MQAAAPPQIDNFESRVLVLQEKLYGFAFKLTKDKQDAEDLLQQTMLKVFKSKHTYKEDKHLSTWVCSIMMNAFRDNHRKKKVRPISVKGSNDEIQGLLMDFGQNHYYENNVADHLEIEIINKAIDSLSDKIKPLILLRMQGYEYSEISEITGVLLGTVKGNIFRGRQLILARLKENNLLK